ncbi:hypothetical protein [Demequina sp. NBRC 110051]|uniref:hypothetical protein n=1 Tax=Demequina sp. NBRC 110051 TaxID=1570340 RepID=UPI0013562C53|nr:hypothetical protein [Demequina sp. NBRC 110051]
MSADLSLASAADLPRQRISGLAQHKDPAVREAIARREDCPFGVLAALAHDSRAQVRIAVAAHPRAGRTVLTHLAADRDPHVVKAVTRNIEAPLDIVEKLAHHRREEVRHLAGRMLEERAAMITAGTQEDEALLFARGGRPSLSLHGAVEQVAQAPTHPSRKVQPQTLAPRPRVGRDGTGMPRPA